MDSKATNNLVNLFKTIAFLYDKILFKIKNEMYNQMDSERANLTLMLFSY